MKGDLSPFKRAQARDKSVFIRLNRYDSIFDGDRHYTISQEMLNMPVAPSRLAT